MPKTKKKRASKKRKTTRKKKTHKLDREAMARIVRAAARRGIVKKK